ncbi:MAG TPA: formate dehydrogenase subunit beta, partial [Deltaproteobacteria bacterium]|nr:formate dehydrogenase subunit beta [Deltaproteobacteria bacterium]
WLFRKDGCMHCTDAACVKVCPSGALFHTEYGTVGLAKEKCIGCKVCIGLGCPAIEFRDEKSSINSSCVGCGVCGELCAQGAIGGGK